MWEHGGGHQSLPPLSPRLGKRKGGGGYKKLTPPQLCRHSYKLELQQIWSLRAAVLSLHQHNKYFTLPDLFLLHHHLTNAPMSPCTAPSPPRAHTLCFILHHYQTPWGPLPRCHALCWHVSLGLRQHISCKWTVTTVKNWKENYKHFNSLTLLSHSLLLLFHPGE